MKCGTFYHEAISVDAFKELLNKHVEGKSCGHRTSVGYRIRLMDLDGKRLEWSSAD